MKNQHIHVLTMYLTSDFLIYFIIRLIYDFIISPVFMSGKINSLDNNIWMQAQTDLLKSHVVIYFIVISGSLLQAILFQYIASKNRPIEEIHRKFRKKIFIFSIPIIHELTLIGLVILANLNHENYYLITRMILSGFVIGASFHFYYRITGHFSPDVKGEFLSEAI